MKFALALCLVACLAVAISAEDYSSRKLQGGYDFTDCKPKEKDCPYGYYCVYYPDKKCKTVKECKTEKVQFCAKYGYVYSDHHSGGYGHGGYGHGYGYGKKEKKCVEYGYKDEQKCYDKKVCYEYICAKLAHGY